MNQEHAVAPHHANNPLDLGRKFRLNLPRLSRNEEKFTIGQFIAGLEATTTLTDLNVEFDGYKPTPSETSYRFIELLCRCLANLRLAKLHPLIKLSFLGVDFRRYGIKNVMEHFLFAARQCGLCRLKFSQVYYLPVQFLVESGRDIKVLELEFVSVVGRTALPPKEQEQPDSSVSLALDKLVLHDVSFKTSTAATEFNNFVAHMNVSALELGEVITPHSDHRGNLNAGEYEDCDPDSFEKPKRIPSEFKMIPSVEQLTLKDDCRIEHVQAALEDGMTSLTELSIAILVDDEDKKERLDLMTKFIRGAVRLKCLTICLNYFFVPPQELFQALEACATVTRVQVQDEELGELLVLTVLKQRQFERITARNRELAHFIAHPSTNPTDKMLTLMGQFDNCPSGLYMLARHLPEVFSFEKGASLFSPVEANPKRKRSKRRKIS